MPTVVQSILLPPSQDIYQKILELEPSDTPIWIDVTNGVETVMYGDIPLQDYLPPGIQINTVDNKPDSANPSGEITLNRATIERGKGGRLIIAHEIGHAIASGRNQYDRNLLRAIANSQNVSLPTNRRIAAMINLTDTITV